MCIGKADYRPINERMGERMHVIGPIDRPIMICKKKDVSSLVTNDFWYYYEIWSYFHFGFGLPGGQSWDEQNPDLMKALLEMEKIYRKEFSTGTVQVKYMESIIKHQRAAMGVKR